MAKRSKSQTEVTINQIMDEAFKQILSIGFEAMSYTTLSEATGISRTGISHHFPKKTDFLVKLDERIGELFVQSMNFSSVSALKESWAATLAKPRYKAVMRLFFSLCGYNDNRLAHFRAVENLESNALNSLGEEGKNTVHQLIGEASVQLLKEEAQ
ncbi:TetR family transcriptional regulator [Shewanella sp. 202IG2-18]|uniref:TetR family transcriptional regulator n=1 Tax=Parashewanella hymeniacidonis TaxID=2807618 RepID=UPI001961A5C2|nr:TetR family transcriptional regulator [Parashewanella hymeniacidonis]MBM7070507.1 TetR family transcriptional regulator [Parashewanella hymeniacidonis]